MRQIDSGVNQSDGVQSSRAVSSPSPYCLQDDDQLCFIHIPKTAGTTLTSILDSKFNRDRICPEHRLIELQEYSAEQIAAYRLFRGHFSYDIGLLLPQAPYLVTMLRDPVERVISAYEFMKTCIIIHPQAAATQQKARTLPLKDYIRDPDVSGVVNAQTRQLAGRAWRGAARSAHSDWLDAAQAHLEEFAFVGLTEQFNESMALLNYTFGWSPLQQVQRLMVGRKRLKREQLTAEELDIILEHNQLDVALYNHAQALFEACYRAMATQLRRDTPNSLSSSVSSSAPEEETVSQQQLEQHYETCFIQTLPPPVAQLTFTFDQGFSGSGWHGWEGEERHLPFRWTGPGPTSTLDFPPLVPNDYAIEIRVINAVTPEMLSTLQLRVDGTMLHLFTLYCDEDTAILRGTIPKAAILDAPFTRLTFQVSHTQSLQSVDPSVPDRRRVGVALDLVQVWPTDDRPAIDATAFLFKDAPQPWQAVETFLRQHLLPEEKIFAPNLFRFTFGDVMPSETSIPSGRIANYGDSRIDPDVYQWAVLHKGMQNETGPMFLRLLASPFAPVLANEVFIVFSSRADLPKLSYGAPHVRYAYTGYVKHRLAQQVAALTALAVRYGKPLARPVFRSALGERIMARLGQGDRSQ
ncbi:MAG: sulfotransferase family 2 domain-containing protein [Elainellaceae cyanobacterium]